MHLRFGLTVLHLVDRLQDHLGVLHQIGADFGAELCALGVCELGQVHGAGWGGEGQCADEGGSDEAGEHGRSFR